MRVLVVDQDSASNEAIVRSLREHYTVDAVTNKSDCLDLLRSNVFEVIVAAERLEDGSGLELLGQIGKRWPNVLRIFSADRERLKLLRGRLGPFDLFQTLAYPIDPERLIATLNLADAAQDAHADTSNIQHVVLTAEPPPEPEDIEAAEESDDSEMGDSEDFPAPRPAARAAPAPEVRAPFARERAEPAQRDRPALVARRGSSRVEPLPREESRARAPARVGQSVSEEPRLREAPLQQSRRNGSAGSPLAREAVSSLAPSFPGSGTLRSAAGSRSRTSAPPVRFPPLEPPKDFAATLPGDASDSFSEAAALAREARDNFEGSTGEVDTRRLVMIGAGAVAALALVLLGFKLFGSRSEKAHPVQAVAVKAPEYSREVTELIAQTESALKSDDFNTARTNVDSLHRLAPSHPRLAFFDGLLAQHDDAQKRAANSARNLTKKGGKSKRVETSAAHDGETATAAVAPSAVTASSSTAPPQVASRGGQTPATVSVMPGLAPETPPGVSRASDAAPTAVATAPAVTSPEPTAPSTSAAAAASSPAAPSVALATTPATPAATTAPAPAVAGTGPASSAPSRRSSSDEPPPVVREAKLIRRVEPDYPSAAKRDGVSGSVDLEVTVSTTGTVKDVSVVRATPPGVFDKPAVAAVRKWKYDPRFVDGLVSEAHLRVHLDFGPGR